MAEPYAQGLHALYTLTEEGQPPVELSTRLHESEAGASDADTSQVSVSSLPEDEGTVSSGLQHMQGRFNELDTLGRWNMSTLTMSEDNRACA